MKWRQGEELVRVQSEGELRPGMTVILKGCWDCRKTHPVILARVAHRNAACCDERCRSPLSWATVGDCTDASADGVCFACPIREGRLFRLRDEETPQEQTTERRREVVR